MEQVLINKSTLTDIGNAIREKEGSTELVPVVDMADRIMALAGASGKRFTTGTVIFSDASLKGAIKITHNLGVKPSVFIMLPKDKTLNFTFNAKDQPTAGIYGAYYLNVLELDIIFPNCNNWNSSYKNSTLEWRANNTTHLTWSYCGTGVTESPNENTIQLGYRSAAYKYIDGLEYEWIAIE